MSHYQHEWWIIGLAAAVAMCACTVLHAQTPDIQLQSDDGKISANLKEIQVTEVLKILAEKSGYNFIIGSGITGTITLYVTDMEPLQLLDVIAELANIGYRKRGNTIRIYNANRYQQVYGQEFVDMRVTATIPLRYVNLQAVAQTVQSVKSPKGTITSDAATNSLIVTDHPENIDRIKGVIAAIDVPRPTEVFTLQNIGATKLVDVLKPYASPSAVIHVNNATNQVVITDSRSRLDQIKPIIDVFDIPTYLETEVFHLRYPKNENLITMIEGELTEGVGKSTFDEQSNSLIVSAIPQEMARIREVLNDLDRGLKSVFIEAKIIQISLNDDFRMGVNWEYVDEELDHLNVRGVFNVLGEGESGMTVTGGNLSDHNYSALVEVLQTTGKTNLLSSPRILTVEGQEAKILVGSTIPYKTIDTREEDGAIRTFEKVTTVDVGVKLFVTTQVDEDNVILMAIRQEVSSVVAFRDGIPEISTSESETKVFVPDGMTIIMAGLIKDEQIRIEKRIPLLGSIPILGYLFRSTDVQSVKNELVVFLTPRITWGEAEASDLKRFHLIGEDGK